MKVQSELESTIPNTPAVGISQRSVTTAIDATTVAFDRADVTGVASSLAAEPLRDPPAEVSEERISALKAAILAGTLRIQPRSLAQCVIDHEVEPDHEAHSG